MSKPTENAQVALTPAWLAAGALLFAVAVATPLFVLNFMPTVTTIDALEESDAPVAMADNGASYPEIELAANDGTAEEQLGSLATLIDKQGGDQKAAGASAVRRMVLDAVSVDLESSLSINALDHLRVPIRDCQIAGNDDTWLIDDGAKISSALHSLPSDLGMTSGARIAGPNAQRFSTTHEGMRIEFCNDLVRISAVEILPMESDFDPETVSTIAVLDAPWVVQGGHDRVGATDPEGQIVVGSAPTGTELNGAQPEAVAIGKLPTRSVPATNVKTDAPEIADASSGIEAGSIVQADATASTPETIDRTESSGLLALGIPELKPNAIEAAPAPSKPRAIEPSALLALNGNAYGVSTDVMLPGRKSQTAVRVSLASAPVLPATDPEQPEAIPTTLLAAYEAAEDVLRLSRRDRWRTQLRLALIGYDPKGIDGIFGDGTRRAISRLQKAEALPTTGYLDETTLTVLNRKSQRGYANWLERRAKRRAERQAQELAAASAPQQVRSVPAARKAPKCARDNKGTIISNQSFDCDWNVLREGLQSLFGSS